MADMKEILQHTEFSQRRLGLLLQMRASLADRASDLLRNVHSEELRVQYAELFGKLDEAIAAEAQAFVNLYDGVDDIQSSEARCLTELLRVQSRET